MVCEYAVVGCGPWFQMVFLRGWGVPWCVMSSHVSQKLGCSMVCDFHFNMILDGLSSLLAPQEEKFS